MSTPRRIIAGLTGELTHVVKDTSSATLTEKHTDIAKALTTLEAHQSADQTIMANNSLSQQGQRESLQKLGATLTAPAFKWLKDKIKEKKEKDQRYRTQFYTITSGIDNAVERMLTYTYLWDRLDPLDQAARATRFIQAAEQDRLTVLAGMLENPLGAMVSEEVKERTLTDRAKRKFPRDFENFEQNTIYLEFLTMMRDWIAGWLFREVGVEIPVIRTNFGDDIADALAQTTTEPVAH